VNIPSLLARAIVVLHRRACDPRRPATVRDYQGQAYSFQQALDNGHACWKRRPLQGGNSDSTLAPAGVRPIFMAVVLDCLAV